MKNNAMISTLFLLGVIFIALTFYRQYCVDRNGKEGFTQTEVFSLKEGNDKYDEFYSEVYDTLNLCDKRAEEESMQVIQMTMPDKKYSVFLDVGSGTGDLVNRLQKDGYRVYGIDQSAAMCKRAITKYGGNIPVKEGDALVSMNFERNTFSHITCLYYTIYEIKDRRQFFKNCYFWMMGGGYLILHLVDPREFDFIVPQGRPSVVDNIQKYANRRITDTIVDFTGYTYTAGLQSPTSTIEETDNIYLIKEEFRDKSTGHVRQNEQMLYMSSIEEILLEAIKCGFLVKGKAEMSGAQDKYQYMYILERTL